MTPQPNPIPALALLVAARDELRAGRRKEGPRWSDWHSLYVARAVFIPGRFFPLTVTPNDSDDQLARLLRAASD